MVGHGAEAFERARQAALDWRMFELDWVSIEPRRPSVEPGSNLVIVAHHFGLWSLSACRVTYLEDEQNAAEHRFAYGHGTLPGHSLQGEERFEVVWDRGTDEVRFRIRKFSRPTGIWRAVTPVVRYLQRSFERDALERMQRLTAA